MERDAPERAHRGDQAERRDDDRDQRDDLADQARPRPHGGDGNGGRVRGVARRKSVTAQPIFAAGRSTVDAGSDHRQRNRRARRRLRALAAHEVVLFEREQRAGGHANTVVRRRDRARHRLPRPQHAQLPAARAAVRRARGRGRTPRRCRSRSACSRCGLEYSGRRPFAQPRNAWRARASTGCCGRSGAGCAPPAARSRRPTTSAPRSATTSTRARYSARFRSHFLVPLTAALWSTAPGRALEFPAAYAIRFFDNHGMLGLRPFPLAHGERRQPGVRAARSPSALGDGAAARDPGARDPAGRRRGSSCAGRGGELERFDRVVVATHADEALALLEDPSEEERRALGGFELHHERHDPPHRRSFLPSARRARVLELPLGETGRPTMTYYLNKPAGARERTRLLRDPQRGGSRASTCSARFRTASALHGRDDGRAGRAAALSAARGPGSRARTSATASTRTGSRAASPPRAALGSGRGEVGALRQGR